MPHLPPVHHETRKRDSPNETKIKENQNKNVLDSNSNIAKSMTHHNQTKELTTWFLCFLHVVLVFLVALLILLLFVIFFPILIGTISNIMTILSTIIASPLGLRSKLLFRVPFEELLLAHQIEESSYKEGHLFGIIFGALIIAIVNFFFTCAFFYNFLVFALLGSFKSNVLFL
jgi:hypothetical protein